MFHWEIQANYPALVHSNSHEARPEVGHVLYHLGVDNESRKDKDQIEVGTLTKASWESVISREQRGPFYKKYIFSFVFGFSCEAALCGYSEFCRRCTIWISADSGMVQSTLLE